GMCDTLWPALFFLALAGGADCVSGIFRLTLWNQTIPDALRGRLAGIEMVSYMSGPLLRHLEAGAGERAVSVGPWGGAGRGGRRWWRGACSAWWVSSSAAFSSLGSCATTRGSSSGKRRRARRSVGSPASVRARRPRARLVA